MNTNEYNEKKIDIINSFIQKYNNLIKELHSLKKRIIDDSKIRFQIIDNFLANLEEEEVKKLDLKELELEIYSEKENSSINHSIKLFDEYQKCKEKRYETKDLLMNSEDEYNNELNNFNRVFNACVSNISNEDYLNSLNKIAEFGYFNETLIDELIETFQKYYSLILSWKEIDNEILISISETDTNIANKHR